MNEFRSSKKRVLLTGGAGFIGHHTVEHLLKETNWDVIILDRLSYAGNQNYITDIKAFAEHGNRVSFVFHDFRAAISETTKDLLGDIDIIIHMGAESHVDRSIDCPMDFAEANVIGTVNMLNYARELFNEGKLERFHYISTDEVYGPAKVLDVVAGNPVDWKKAIHLHKENERFKPSNPYSASKAGAEAFCYAYFNTYGMPIVITNTMNNFGERQNFEKFVPKVAKMILEGKPMTIHCKKDDLGNILEMSSRCWLHARNHADGMLFVLEHGVNGESYNITGEWADVSMMADMIADILGKPVIKEFEDFHSFRPGHDMHYGLDGTKLREMGWVPPFTLRESLERTITWMKENPKWLGVSN